METKKKKSGGIIFLSIYFIVFGLLFLTNAFYPTTDKELKKEIYERGRKKLPAIEKEISSVEFSRSDYRREILFAVKSLKKEIRRFKQETIDKDSIVAVLISYCGVLVGILFIAIGVGTIIKRIYPFKLVAPTLILLALFSGLYFYNTNLDMKYYDGISVRVWEISAMFSAREGKEQHKELRRSFTQYLFFRTLIFICFVMCFYLLPLIYLINIQNKERQKLVGL